MLPCIVQPSATVSRSGEEQRGQVEGGVERDGGKERALTADKQAEPEADEEEGQAEGVGAMGEGEEDGAQKRRGPTRQDIGQRATVKKLLRERPQPADEGQQGHLLQGREGADQTHGGLGGPARGDVRERPGPRDQADGMAEEGAQPEARRVRCAPREDPTQAGAVSGEEPRERGQEEERQADGLGEKKRGEGVRRRRGGRLRGQVGEAEEQGDGQPKREGEDAQEGLAKVKVACRHVTGWRGRPR